MQLEIPGIIAGVISGSAVVLIVESILFLKGWLKRRNNISHVRQFFHEMRTQIKDMAGTEDGRINKGSMQFVYFRAQLKDAKTMIDVRVKNFSDKQHFEVAKVITDAMALNETIPPSKVPEEKMYDLFFEKLESFTWLGFQIYVKRSKGLRDASQHGGISRVSCRVLRAAPSRILWMRRGRRKNRADAE